jgi:hypothetical protein
VDANSFTDDVIEGYRRGVVGGCGGVDVEDEGVPEVTPAHTLNFTGAGVTVIPVTPTGPGLPCVAEINIPGGGGPGVATYDAYLDQWAGADSDPIFTDMPPIQAKIAALPAISTAPPMPVTNTLWLGPDSDLLLLSPGAYTLGNTEIRGMAPWGGIIVNDAVLVYVAGDGNVVFTDVRTFRDVCFDNAPDVVGPTFDWSLSPYCEFENVSVISPINGSADFGVFAPSAGLEKIRINKCDFAYSSFEMTDAAFDLDVDVETNNVISAQAFVSNGAPVPVRLLVKGSGNHISTWQPTVLLDVDIGDVATGGSVQRFSCAESITFGSGENDYFFSEGVPVDAAYQLRPGGGMNGDPTPPREYDPLLTAGKPVRGIVRGIHVQVGSTLTLGSLFDIWVMENGVLKYQETGFTFGACVGLGSYKSTTFGEITGATGSKALAIWLHPVSAAGNWDHINVTVFIK